VVVVIVGMAVAVEMVVDVIVRSVTHVHVALIVCETHFNPHVGCTRQHRRGQVHIHLIVCVRACECKAHVSL
jgi:hypothetical protein